ncbi:uncharacterized protein LOC107198869 isoform X2 [Parus major]|uniref:uncharacterized protein LOC107198869 isoform X2 n=1 Tax=Parus major TaxID=9157 RepID=UPI0014445337|nr:uncharacterized protein LOC107198869 isoform X2 [Parus major]
MEPGKNAALDEWDAQIRKLPEEFESDTDLEECDTENGELAAEIAPWPRFSRSQGAEGLNSQGIPGKSQVYSPLPSLPLPEHLTATLGKLTSDLGESNSKLKERDRKITKLAAEIRRFTALLAERDSGLRKLQAELAKCDATIRIFTVELGERHTKIGELTADVEICTKRLQQHQAELGEELSLLFWGVFQENRGFRENGDFYWV